MKIQGGGHSKYKLIQLTQEKELIPSGELIQQTTLMNPRDVLTFFLKNKNMHNVAESKKARLMAKELSESFFQYSTSKLKNFPKKRFVYATSDFDRHMSFFQHFDKRFMYLLSGPEHVMYGDVPVEVASRQDFMDNETFQTITIFYALVIKKFILDNLVQG